MEMVIWNSLLSAFSAVLLWVWKDKSDELKRVQILLNKTREEIARDTATKTEVARVTDHIDQRFNKLEEKIDRLLQAGK